MNIQNQINNMEVIDYFVECTHCHATTKKEKALALVLKEYHHTLIHFSDESAKNKLTDQLKEQLNQINMMSRGRDIGLEAYDYNGVRTIAFHPVPSNGESTATMTLFPVKRYLEL